jgi:hypothetical protein
VWNRGEVDEHRSATPALVAVRDTDERYLAEAVDLADLERRMRVLERASAGPSFVTFNH